MSRAAVASPRASRTRSARVAALMGTLAVTMLLGTAVVGCKSEEEKAARWPAATIEALAKAVEARLPKMQKCWDAGSKRSSFLPGERQVVRVDVKPKGVVRTSFLEAAHNRHPVGSCVRSAFDGLRFAPREAPIAFEVPLHLGATQQQVAAGAPSQASASGP